MRFAPIVAAKSLPSRRVCFHFMLMALCVFAGIIPVWPQTPPKSHIVRVNFDYDFKQFHGCKKKNKAPCLKEFNVYNMTDTGKRILLFFIPAPPGAKGEVKNISGASTPLVFAPGQHMIAVTAETDQGGESNPSDCRTMVNVAP